MSQTRQSRPVITPPQVFLGMLRSAIVALVLVVVGWLVVVDTLPILSAPPMLAKVSPELDPGSSAYLGSSAQSE